jgi:hypothetical protein
VDGERQLAADSEQLTVNSRQKHAGKFDQEFWTADFQLQTLKHNDQTNELKADS